MSQRTAFGGRYSVIDSAGVGGMAEVYRARDDLLGREVAVKVLSERFAQDRAFVERFRREAQAVANLNHPNIVSLYDFGSEGSTYYIVMEFIDGRSLEDIIRDDGPLLPERAAEIAADVAWALERAHVAGLVHRDVKPSNIMLSSSGQTKVTDFGIVRALSRDSEQTMTQAGMVIGTAAYLSPEQAQGKELDGRSDIYSVGVVLYEMLTGGTPFGGETPLAIAYKHVRENADVPSSINPDVPGALDSIVMKAMAKNPDNRFASAADMRADLLRYLSGQPVQATPVLAGDAAPDADTMVATPLAPGTAVLDEAEPLAPPRGNRSRAAWYVLGALLLVALVAGLGIFLWNSLLRGDENPPAPPRIEVPDLVGQDVNDARDRLEELRLGANVEPKASRQPLNQVIRQDPEAGRRLERGGEVTLTVSTGPRQTAVPDLAGQPVDAAETLLADAGLELGTVTEEPSDAVEDGAVVSQSPLAGSEVDAGSAVDVVLSTGAEAVQVPFVEGQSEATAVDEIEAVGLVARVTREPSPDVEEGTVISQDPGGGDELEAGDQVTILVSQGAEQVALEDLTGLPAGQAAAILRQAGFEVSEEDFTGECAEPPGTVCDQDPPPGTTLDPGQTVTLFVSPSGA